MTTTPKRRARTNRRASQRSLASELAQTKAALETLAQMVVGGRLNSDGLLAALRSTSGAESLGDAMRARLIEAQLNLAYTKVEAPAAGVTSRSLRSEGTLVPGPDVLLTTITQLDPIWVNFGIPDNDQLRMQADVESGRLVLPPQRQRPPGGLGQILSPVQAVEDLSQPLTREEF